jgi:hypothetical protein
MLEEGTMSRKSILAKVEALSSSPTVFQALWDGDSNGWFVRFSTITNDGQSHPLDVLSDGGDIRLFNGQVPSWTEAIAAGNWGTNSRSDMARNSISHRPTILRMIAQSGMTVIRVILVADVASLYCNVMIDHGTASVTTITWTRSVSNVRQNGRQKNV